MIHIETTYSGLQQVYTLPTKVNDYVSQLRTKAQTMQKFQEIVGTQEKIVGQAQGLLKELQQKMRVRRSKRTTPK